MIDQSLVTIRVEELNAMLLELAPTNTLAASLSTSLRPLMREAMEGRVLSPMTVSKIPANRTFTEGMMDDTPELVDAYGAFVAALAGIKG